MSLFKRQARRVAAVGVGVGLLVLGLEAPALAVGPTTTGVSPTSGPTGCVVDITGTGYSGSTKAQTDVNFHTGGTPGTDVDAASFSIISDTEIWATVPSTLVAEPGTRSGSTTFWELVSRALRRSPARWMSVGVRRPSPRSRRCVAWPGTSSRSQGRTC